MNEEIDETETTETTESARVTELKRRLQLYKDMEEKMLSGGAQSYNIGNRSLTRYGLSLADVQKKISELEEEINAEENGASRWSGNFYPTDD